MNIFEFWNESSEFPLFLMGKFALIYECFGLRARFRNELCSQTKVPPYILLGADACMNGKGNAASGHKPHPYCYMF
jgi:hypothetical protein